ncbi:MAG: fibronectin type III domain-containing protein [Ignavibacteriales bacterium]|nr:fibronectin type III domain-containing protein [Ignavibacteriales bacterium]
MGKIKLNLRNLNVTEKIQFARQIVTGITGNASFPTPDPPLATITNCATDLENAFNDANVAKQEANTKVSIQDGKENVLDINLQKLANYVESASNGDDAKIQSAGMSIRAKGVPIGALSLPSALSATAGAKEGEIVLRWDRVTGAKSYIVEQSADQITSTSWKYAGVSTKASIIISGLTSGTKYWFRVAGIGAAGQGAWSDPATKYAP